VTLRNRLFVLVAGTVTLAVALVTWTVATSTRHAFETLDDQRTAALVTQFQRDFARHREDVARRADGIAGAESLLKIAIDLSRPATDYAPYVNEASALAAAHGLDLVELVAGDGTIVSSAQWPARFGYQLPWVLDPVDWNKEQPFLWSEELPGGVALALVAVRSVSAGEQKLYLIAGQRLDQQFLGSLVLPAGMRALLYRNFDPGFSADQLIDQSGKVPDADRLEPLVSRVRTLAREGADTIQWPEGAETFQAIPLIGRGGSVLGVLLVGSSRRELMELVAGIRRSGLIFGGAAVLLGLALSYVVSARVTRPVERLAEGARAVAGGNWDARVDVGATGEVGALEDAFNAMTGQLADQRQRLVQAERVAAWRELARRLAHELKNPLFPLRITVENLQRAKAQAPGQFDEVFDESTTTLLTEIGTLNAIIGRFGDFARMPPPRFDEVRLNDLVVETLKLFEAQFQAPGYARIVVRRDLGQETGAIPADPEQLGRALRNLLLNAVDAMPLGGTITVRTSRQDAAVHLEVSDTGEGLTAEECTRLFTPYYTTKQHGTGLGLAIVQSVVSDHRGKISVESVRGRGTTFFIELPASHGSAIGDQGSGA
jgi:two-component system nitrogen regulation sensor histidine kinase NtrY